MRRFPNGIDRSCSTDGATAAASPVQRSQMIDKPPPEGLTSEEAARRLARDGANQIERGQVTSPWAMLAGQFASPVVWMLIGACVISGFLGELADAIAIFSI